MGRLVHRVQVYKEFADELERQGRLLYDSSLSIFYQDLSVGQDISYSHGYKIHVNGYHYDIRLQLVKFILH